MTASIGAEVAPFRPRDALRGILWIYGLTIVSCFLINIWVAANPIGPWQGDEIDKNFWLDNVSWQLFAAWWACLFSVAGFWPFESMESTTARGIVVVIASWVLGWISVKLVYALGLGADGLLPLIGTTWFLLVFFCFAGGNWFVEKLPHHRQFSILLLLFTGTTFLIFKSEVVWIPAWWFPLMLVGLATGTWPYLARGLPPPARAVAVFAIVFSALALCLEISKTAGIWDATSSPVSAFWSMGHFTDERFWLLCFMVGTSVNYAFPIITHNWPFTKIAMPWGGLLACLFYLTLDIVVASILMTLIGSIFSSMEELLTYAYMGVNWSLVLPLVFGLGFERPYLWKGQITPGAWDDIR